MAAAIHQQTAVGLRDLSQQQTQSTGIPRTVDDDVALASYINNKLHLETQQQEVSRDSWSFPSSNTSAVPSDDWNQQQQREEVETETAQSHYYNSTVYDQRLGAPLQPRIPGTSSTVHITKSSSTPPKRSSQLLMQQQQQHYGRQQQEQYRKVTERPPSLSSTTSSSAASPSPSLVSGRRDSVNSVSSETFSIRSSMTVNTRLSLSKRLRKVFSMNSLRSQTKETISEEPSQQRHQRSHRRRSFASFLKKDSSSAASDHGKDRSLMTTKTEPPMPSPSSSSTCSEPISLAQQHQLHGFNMAPQVGIHYGLPMHASPRLKPAPAMSSTSSINSMSAPLERRRLYFSPTIQVHETFPAAEYDRRTDSNATCQKMNRLLAVKIKQELNEYKLLEMHVHDDSRQFTQFFL